MTTAQQKGVLALVSTFSKVAAIVALSNKCTRTLTFENFCQVRVVNELRKDVTEKSAEEVLKAVVPRVYQVIPNDT